MTTADCACFGAAANVTITTTIINKTMQVHATSQPTNQLPTHTHNSIRWYGSSDKVED